MSEHVARVVEIADLVAADSDVEAVLLNTLGRVRKRGWTDE